MLASPGSSPIECGTLGGLVGYSIGGRSVLRSRSRVPAGSLRQQRVRRIFGGLAMQWSIGLTSGQRASWDTFAAAAAEMSGGCHPRLKSGYDFWLAANLPRVNVGLLASFSFSRVLTAPADATRPPQVSSVSSASVSGTSIVMAGALSGASPGTGICLLYLLSPESSAGQVVGNPWHLATIGFVNNGESAWEININQNQPLDWAAAWSVASGDRTRVKLRMCYFSGRTSRAFRSTVVWS